MIENLDEITMSVVRKVQALGYAVNDRIKNIPYGHPRDMKRARSEAGRELKGEIDAALDKFLSGMGGDIPVITRPAQPLPPHIPFPEDKEYVWYVNALSDRTHFVDNNDNVMCTTAALVHNTPEVNEVLIGIGNFSGKGKTVLTYEGNTLINYHSRENGGDNYSPPLQGRVLNKKTFNLAATNGGERFVNNKSELPYNRVKAVGVEKLCLVAEGRADCAELTGITLLELAPLHGILKKAGIIIVPARNQTIDYRYPHRPVTVIAGTAQGLHYLGVSTDAMITSETSGQADLKTSASDYRL